MGGAKGVFAALTVPGAPVQQIQNKIPYFVWFLFLVFLMHASVQRNPKNKNPLAGIFFVLNQWSWRESNPRPNKEPVRFLHA